jgi:hypothetical protein
MMPSPERFNIPYDLFTPFKVKVFPSTGLGGP